MSSAPDVIVVGGGIAGLAAALRLKSRGLAALVLEATPRIGGRMTTDRVNGYAIDTGVTLLGNRFRGMQAIARRLAVPMAPVAFSLAVQDGRGARRYRAQRALDLFSDPTLSLAAKIAAGRLMVAMLLGGRGMVHGHSDRALALDAETVGEYLQRLGRGGQELLASVFDPALRAALGGAPATASRLVLLQVIWNTLGAGFWNVDGGVDTLPEAMAMQVAVEREVRARGVKVTTDGVEVDVETADSSKTLRARAVILAVPGQEVPRLFPGAPDWMREAAAATRYSPIASAHVALSRPPLCPHAGYAFAGACEDGLGALELEHHRAPGRCPQGKGMISVYFVDGPRFRCLEADDVLLREKAVRVVERTFPEIRNAVEFVHIIRWPVAVAQFPAGRLGDVVRLRRRLAAWDAPVDLAGDWLDGVASESALQMGEQAADRIGARIGAQSGAASLRFLRRCCRTSRPAEWRRDRGVVCPRQSA